MSTKIYQNLLDALKKANKVAKQKMAEKNGFKTVEAFTTFLMDLVTPPGATKTIKAEVKPAGKATGKVTGKKAGPKVSTPKTKKDTKGKVEEQLMDKVIAFDTTGSMAAYIENVKTHVTKLIPKLLKDNPNMRLKIVAFGDYCDMANITENKFGSAYQESPFTNDADVLINFTKHADNTAGGDGDEFYELVIKKINEETPWREGSNRSVLFIGDASPHAVGYSYDGGKQRGAIKNAKIDWKQEAKVAASMKIEYDTLSIHGTPWYKELSDITNGVYLKFQSSGKMADVVYAATSVRGTTLSKASFTTASMDALASGDDELIGVFKSLSSKL